MKKLIRFLFVSYVALFSTVLFGQDSLTVKMERISTGGISAKGKTAGFPYAVFSVISVADHQGRFVSGLADTATWLGAADSAPKGVIRNLWTSAKEYFAADSSLPANSDLFAQRIETQFLEISQNNDVPTSVMLVMDQSRSLKQFELDTAKQAHKNFVNAMGPVDRVGIVRFAENSDAIGITSDKDTLLNFIDSTTRIHGTRIFRAVARGLDSLKLETSQRRIMILFTDGQNDDPQGPDLDSLIAEFNKENITVYTVGLDVGVQGKGDLQKLASRTGGYFYDTNDASDILIFYDRLIELTHQFYLMAHYSPAPCGDEAGGADSTRTVAVKVTDLVRYGSAIGNYNPPATPKTYDLAVSKSADKDTLNLSENLGYQIDIINSGSDTAFDIFVVDTISTYLTASGYSIAPDSVSGNKHYWHFDSLATGNTISINYTAALTTTPPDTITALQSGVAVFTSCDNNAGNDASGVSVTLNRNTVMLMTTTVQTDSFIVDNGDTTWYAFPGDSICFTINVSNTGSNVAQNVVLLNILPDSVSFSPFGGGDTLMFNLGNLAIGADTTLSICPVFVADSLPFYPFTLDNETILNADNIPGSVTERDTVTVLAPPPLSTILDVTRKVESDSFTVISGDTTWYAATGETYAIRITVKNIGSIAATNVLLRDVLPDSVINGGDTLSFALGDLPAGVDTTVTVTPTVVGQLPFAPFPLVNTILASADNADPPQQIFVDTVLAYIPANNGLTDVCIITTLEADSFVVTGNDTTWYVAAGDSFCIAMAVKNKGAITANNVLLTYIPPALTFGINYNGGDTLTWQLGALPPFTDTTIIVCPTVTDTLSRNNIPLDNTTTVSADNDDPAAPGPNTAQDTLFAFPRMPQYANLVINKSVRSDSFSVQQGDTIWYIKPNIPFTYYIQVKNTGSITAENVVVTDRLPSILTALPNSFVPSNGLYEGDSIVWQLGNMSAGEIRIIRFNAVIENTIPENNQEVVNTASVSAANQDTSQTNTTVSTSPAIFVRPPLREDCSYFTLDFNVFEPDNGLPLGINFELATSKAAVIELLDISGYRIAKLYDDTFNAGVNRREWNGNLDRGISIGSGTYIITLRTKDGKLICWKKVIVRR